MPDDQQRDFNPDRPSQFTGPFTVDAGHFQLEMDLANYTLDRHNPEHAPSTWTSGTPRRSTCASA